MRILIIALAMAACLPAGAQIFADIAISVGGNPLGTIRARLDFDKAPRTCANFIGLATGERPWIDVNTSRIIEGTPYYDGRIFHRLIHNFVIQGGSSDGVGSTGSGYVIQDEFHPDLRHSGRYFLSMAKGSLPGTGNSQFFITLENAGFLDDKHSVFGEVISGNGIIDNFANSSLFPTDTNDRPVTEIKIDSVTLSGSSLDTFDIHDPALELPTFKGIRPLPSRNTAEASFTTTFNREAGHDYLYGYSFDLGSWTPFRNILSVDSESSYDFTTTGLTFDRFFARIGAINYSFLHNPSAASIPGGASLTFTTRANDYLTLGPNGSGGGSWSDSNGGSGSLVTFQINDLAPATGAFLSTTTQAHFLPLLQINFELDAMGGPSSRTSYELNLDFRDPTSGWSDGTGWNALPQLDGVSFLNAFQVTPP